MSAMKIDLELSRIYRPTYTQGILSVVGKPFECPTLELPDLKNTTDISCVPEGCYDYFYREDGSNGKCLELKHVVNRTHIQIHVGNWLTDTKGCILPGQSFELLQHRPPMVTNSGNTLTRLFKHAPKKGVIKITH